MIITDIDFHLKLKEPFDPKLFVKILSSFDIKWTLVFCKISEIENDIKNIAGDNDYVGIHILPKISNVSQEQNLLDLLKPSTEDSLNTILVIFESLENIIKKVDKFSGLKAFL